MSALVAAHRAAPLDDLARLVTRGTSALAAVFVLLGGWLVAKRFAGALGNVREGRLGLRVAGDGGFPEVRRGA